MNESHKAWDFIFYLDIRMFEYHAPNGVSMLKSKIQNKSYMYFRISMRSDNRKGKMCDTFSCNYKEVCYTVY